jgi:hypothetical protein
MRRASPLSLVVALTLLASAPALAIPQQVRLGWQGPTDTTMTVTWRSSDPTGSVELGDAQGYSRTVSATSRPWAGTWLHRAELTGLSPATRYHYRCGTPGSWSSDFSFTTAPPVGSSRPFRFVAWGDSRSNDSARRQVAEAALASLPAFSIFTGDLVENGSDQQQWDEWFATFQPLIARSPVMPTPGNHEERSFRYFEQLAMPRHSPAVAGYDDRAWYSFDYGNTHFISLSTEEAVEPGGPQTRWLEADLARAAQVPAIRWIVVFTHRPAFSSGTHAPSPIVRDTWAPLFERYGVDVAFFGHDHHYERSHPIAGGRIVSAEAGGVIHIVTGGAGAPLRSVKPNDLAARTRSVFHFVEVSVTDTEMRIEARDRSGRVFDSVALRKTPARTTEGGPHPRTRCHRAGASGAAEAC